MVVVCQVNAAPGKAITVISDDNYPPYLFKDDRGNTVGIVADYWKLWEQKTGISVTLLSTSWEMAQQQLLSGHADVIEMIFRNPEREIRYAFSAPYATVPVGIYAHESMSGLISADSLTGFTVGVQKGDGCIFKLKEAGVKSFRVYNSYDEIIQATLSEKVMISCMDDYPARYYLYRLGAESNILRAFTLYQGRFHRAVKKENPQMLALVEQGAAMITAEEMAAIESKWKGSHVPRNAYSRQAILAVALMLVIGFLLVLLIYTLRVAVRRKTAEIQSKSEEIENQRLRLTEIIDATRAGTWEWNMQTGECQFNARWAEIVGYTLDELQPLTLDVAKSLMHPDDLQVAMQMIERHLNGEIDFYECDIRMRHKDGRWIWVSDRGSLISRTSAGTPLVMRGTHFDITDKKAAEEVIWRQANYDSLTQLPNRHYFNQQLVAAIQQASAKQQRLTLLFLDLDQFKDINDTLGHHRGDDLLVEVGRRIEQNLPQAATAARLGGDEFAIILPADDADLQTLCNQLLQDISHSYTLGGERIFVTASIGISQFPDDAVNADEMIQHSDQAMYEAKSRGRNNVRFFSLAIRDALAQRTSLARDLRSAVENNELRDYYQPIICLRTGKIVKAETLMRWQHPTRGLISPTLFIPVAEEIGEITRMGDWIFRQAVQNVLKWQSLVDDEFAISVNKSPMQFVEPSAISYDWVQHLQTLGVEGKRIVVEITEGLLLHPDPVVEQRLLHFRDRGIQVAIDDFGTGYSSLSYLSKFDIDYLKIDQSFTRNLNEGNESYVLCEAIIVMAHKLGLKVIAEGVETALQRNLLRDIHCDYAQGFFYSPPIAAEAFEQLLKAESQKNWS
ncbi:MAG TPA: EAL domain-containing protein [Methylophilus sp.]|uniref:EAL domain-containing protein n=1 Tax=Methylophilus sp. TaxID=29541 RepID=UPI002C0C0CA8|nr:EAL domain-containing protein [Methylophilus sp.]HSH86409.1 EAL domain-containing protein [Methylophilus sp.]